MISKLCGFFSSTKKEEKGEPQITGKIEDISPLDLQDTVSTHDVIFHINAEGLEILFRDLQLPFGDFVIQMDNIGREHIMDMLDRVAASRMGEVLGMDL